MTVGGPKDGWSKEREDWLRARLVTLRNSKDHPNPSGTYRRAFAEDIEALLDAYNALVKPEFEPQFTPPWRKPPMPDPDTLPQVWMPESGGDLVLGPIPAPGIVVRR